MIIGFLLTALYIPGIAGAATTPKWALLAVALPLLNWRPLPGKFTLTHLFGALFLTWSATSLIWTPNRLDGIGEPIKLAIVAQAFIYGSKLSSLNAILHGMALSLCVSSIVVLIQLSWPDLVAHSTPNSGLFVNSGSLAEISALVLIGLCYECIGHFRSPVCVAGRGAYRWILVIALMPCVILPQSRGAWLALAAAFTVWLWSRSRLSALALTALSGIVLVWSIRSGWHVSSIAQRLGMWDDAFGGLNWLGHGLGSLWTDFAPLSNTLDIFVERPEHLHNDWLEILFELGPIGLSLLGVAIYSAIRGQCDLGSKLILAGFIAESCVGFPLHNPCTAFVAALCLGHLARDRAGLRDLFHAGRVLLFSRQGRPGRAGEYSSLSPQCGTVSIGSQV